MAELTFAMGDYQARFPTDRQYTRHHLWASSRGSIVQFGFTAYAERMLRDVYFLDWSVPEQTPVQPQQSIGSIESKKANSELYAPLAGNLIRFNMELMNDPSVINRDVYGKGWLYEIETEEADELLPASAYLEHLKEVWKVTQRLLKGQS